MRSAEQKRAMEGIARVNSRTAEELISNPNDWDTAQIRVSYPDGLAQLDQAGMLLDLSQSSYLASRESIDDSLEWCNGLPNGIFSADNRLIGVPSYPFTIFDEDDKIEVLIINAKSNHIDDAMRYVEYHIKAMEDAVFSPDEETMNKVRLAYSTAL